MGGLPVCPHVEVTGSPKHLYAVTAHLLPIDFLANRLSRRMQAHFMYRMRVNILILSFSFFLSLALSLSSTRLAFFLHAFDVVVLILNKVAMGLTQGPPEIAGVSVAGQKPS